MYGTSVPAVTILDYLRAVGMPRNLDTGAVWTALTRPDVGRFMADLRARYRHIGPPAAIAPSIRPLLGYSFEQLGRALVNPVFSYPDEVFVTHRSEFTGSVLTLLAYFPELTLSLEMATDEGIPGGHNVGTPLGDTPVTTEALNGFLAVLHELRALIENGILHVSPAHFFNDGSRRFLFNLRGLERIELVNGPSVSTAMFPPDARADLGVGLYLHSDFITDSPQMFERVTAAFAALGVARLDGHRERSISVVSLPVIELPWFKPTHPAELAALRAEPAIKRLHDWFRCRDAMGGQNDTSRMTQQVIDDVWRLAGRFPTASRWGVRLTTAAVTTRLVNPLTSVLMDNLPVISVMSGSGLHAFAHWFLRRCAGDGQTAQMVMLVCLQIH